MPLGLYVSDPFCRTKCSYCNFASEVFSRSVFQRYVDHVCSAIARANETAEQMGGRFDPARFVAYVMMHEFEGLLFSDCARFAACAFGMP